MTRTLSCENSSTRQQEENARRVLEVLPKRFVRFGLMRHPQKT